MAGDTHGTRGDTPVSGVARIPAQRSGVDLVAPVTLGPAAWRRRHLRLQRAVDGAVLACSPVLYVLLHGRVAMPLLATALSVLALAGAGRGALHLRLRHLRRHGRAMAAVLAVGDAPGVTELIARTQRDPGLGWRVRSACTSTGAGPDGASVIAGVPVVGDLDGIASLALAEHVDAIAVGPTPGWTAVRLQQLAWDLDCSHTALLVDPRLVGLVGPRMRVTGVPGLPLLRLEHPTLGRGRRLVKGTLDRVGALFALIVVAPVLVSCAAAVRRDGGPALRRRPHLGLGGREFSLLTLRTTDTTGALTPVGRILRRHCLDELPQLLNVLGGSMALVGPRPPTPYGPLAAPEAPRHLLVKPGITGLWQVVGDGDRYEDETADLDLRYVRRWSPALDARILLHTVRATLRSTSNC